jgi:hypothetical protein
MELAVVPDNRHTSSQPLGRQVRTGRSIFQLRRIAFGTWECPLLRLLTHVAPISIAFSHCCLRLLPAIGGKGTTNGDLFLEFALIITPHIPSIAGMRLDHGSLTGF